MEEMIPTEFYLSQNYPNPFKGKTTIKYCVPDKTLIKLTVLDSDMMIIEELENEVKDAGTYEVEFDGNEVPDGIYFYQLRAKDFAEIKRMVVMK
jgi:hypothetical protein